MNDTGYRLIRAGMITVSLVLAVPVHAQMGGGHMMGGGMIGGQQGMGRGMQQTEKAAPGAQEALGSAAPQMSAIMRDMADQLAHLSRQMSKGEMAVPARQRHQEQMWEMAMMMEKLSGMIDTNATTNPDTQRQLDEMRNRMEGMRQAAR